MDGQVLIVGGSTGISFCGGQPGRPELQPRPRSTRRVVQSGDRSFTALAHGGSWMPGGRALGDDAGVHHRTAFDLRLPTVEAPIRLLVKAEQQ